VTHANVGELAVGHCGHTRPIQAAVINPEIWSSCQLAALIAQSENKALKYF
jgi:hypothetical protein